MNLEKTIIWSAAYIEEKKKEGAKPEELTSYLKMQSWLEECLRYRLFYSEIINEIELSEQPIFTKERLVKFLEDESKEWKLKDVTP